MGSFRFRRSLKIAPGIRLNVNKRSVGISAGTRGARYSINSDGRRTRSVGIPGTGLSYRSQTGATRDTSDEVSQVATVPSLTRLVASLVGWLTVLLFVLALFSGDGHLAGVILVYGLVVYFGLRLLRGLLDSMAIWLLTRRRSSERR